MAQSQSNSNRPDGRTASNTMSSSTKSSLASTEKKSSRCSLESNGVSHKNEGVTYLRIAYATAKRNPHNKFMSIPMKQAEDILNQMDISKPIKREFKPKDLCIKTAAVALCMSDTELCMKLNNPVSKDVLNALTEQRHLVLSMQKCGDKWLAGHQSVEARNDWAKAKTFSNE